MKVVLSLALLSTAVVMDIRSSKISNRLILGGLATGFLIRIIECGVRGIGVFLINASIPVILFYLLFLMRALGAGDIKLFSVIGGIWNLKMLFMIIIVSFLAAAGMSFCKMLYHRNLISRLFIFGRYVRETVFLGRLQKYPIESEGKQHIIHFSIAIFIGFITVLEVVY